MARKTEIRLRRSNNANAIPTHTNLGDGEMAMNTADGALYFKKSDNTIITAHDDTIMHIDSTNDAVDIYGALSIGPGDNTTASIAIPAGLSTTDSADQVGKVLEISAYDSTNHIYSTQWAAPITRASFTGTTNAAAQRNGYGTLAYNSSTGQFLYTAPHVENLADAHLNTPSSGTGANSILTWSGTDYQWSTPAADNIISLDNTNVTVTDNGSDAGYISATVDGTLISTTNANGITVVGNVEATEFIGDVRGAVLFKAKAGEALAKGDVVYIDQYDAGGNQTVVAKANASDAAKMPAFGIAAAAANANTNVDVYTFGTLGGLNTSSFSVNDELYVSAATAGALVNTAPAGNANLIQKIAKVTRSHASSGSIKIMGAGRTNATPNLDEGKIFVGNASNKSVQVDDTLEVDMANSEVRASSKLHVFPNTPVTGKKSLLELDAVNAKHTIRQTLLRNSDNATYSTGDTTGFDYFDAIVLDADGDDAKISLYHTTGSTASDSHDETIRLLSDGDSYISNPLRVGNTTGTLSTNTSLSVFNSTGANDIFEVIGNNSNSSITSGNPVALFKQRVNATTNTTTSGEFELNNIVEVGGSALSVPRVRLASDLDEDSFILGTFSTTDQIVTGTLTADKVPLLASALGWVPAFGTNDESKIVWDSTEDAIAFTPATANGGLVHTAFRVYSGQKVHITLPQKASASSASGLTIKVYQHNGDLPTGKTHVGDTAVGTFSSFMQDDDAQYTIVSNVATSTTWINRTLEFTPTADGYASIGVYVSSAVGTKKILLKQPKITNAGIGIGDVIAIQYLLG